MRFIVSFLVLQSSYGGMHGCLLYTNCHLAAVCLFKCSVPRVGLRRVIVAFPGHTSLT